MAYTIPTTEPTAPRAGDTWQWTKSLADYPATTWTLSYTAWNASTAFSITASASGTDHSVSVSSVVTAAYTAGRYEWVARVTDGTSTYTVGAGTWSVLAAVGEAMDTRSHSRKMLDAIQSMIEGRATAGDLDVIRTTYGDRTVQWDLPTLLKMRQQYSAAVASEESAAALARGDHDGRFLRVRFVR